MTQHDKVIDNASFPTVRADINDALESEASNNSGASAPSDTFPFMFWADTANDLMKQRNAADSAWISLYTLSTGAPLTAATTSASGVIELATLAEAKTGTDTSRAIVPDVMASLLMEKGNDIASATTLTIPTDGCYFDVTGTTTITGLSSPSVIVGWEMILKFEGALTLTHNATSLILPGGANITTANGDTARFRYEGSGNWRCINYQKVDGTAVVSSGLAAGSQSDQETATSTTVAVTPGRQQFHPSACKFWIYLTGTGTIANNASYNVSGITDNGTGDYTVTHDVDFSGANYCVLGTVGSEAPDSSEQDSITVKFSGGLATTATRVLTGASSTGVRQDRGIVMVAGFGDQ